MRDGADTHDRTPSEGRYLKVATLVVWAVIVCYLILWVFFLRHPLGSECGFACDGTSSVSNAPGP